MQGRRFDELVRDDQFRDSVIRKLDVIGEATKRLSQEFRSAHATVAWKRIAGLRDRLIHAYDDIDLDRIWQTAAVDVPKLLVYLEPLLPPEP